MFNPLLDTTVRDRTWYDIAEELQDKVGWVARKGRSHEAFKWLNVLDLIDGEASAYWRNYGMDLYAGREVEIRVRPAFNADGGTATLDQAFEGVSIL